MILETLKETIKMRASGGNFAAPTSNAAQDTAAAVNSDPGAKHNGDHVQATSTLAGALPLSMFCLLGNPALL